MCMYEVNADWNFQGMLLSWFLVNSGYLIPVPYHSQKILNQTTDLKDPLTPLLCSFSVNSMSVEKKISLFRVIFLGR